ncbi:MAG: nitrogen regulation protein NR(I) [Devosia sp.]|jgi:two-component system nitrogen regulation response regulator GlnG|uniref:nitrogen regulation protein NR(I) n=1 Tax=unclassified Devosia TaxID=196773 RepID=UPI0019D922E8|nr:MULTISPECIES: nitrogen regulation protein NR(I) [unclassified Devosia]MBF0678303.1 nitrogen regulation protein NR(I) [Devosia sp.]WEJ31557.1 nitrogen regulation protein NR(I) [Devosia sp. SD17-2]
MSHVVLLADDDAAIRMVLNQALTRAGYEVRPTGNISTMWNWVSRGEGDVLITDVAMPDGNAFEVMPKIKKVRPDLPMIVMSAQNTFMTAIRASEVGAYEYLPKPFDITEVLSVVSRALADAKKPSNEERKSEDDAGDTMPLVGRSAAMQEIYRALARLMQTDLTVMITGESGTGKELVARALHDFGKRRNGPFVAINMAAIPRDLIEAELFGHEKGAFTGANTRSSGRFEQAEGGTLFLDEIGDMPMDAQTRLLRVLQEGEYTMVGGRSAIKTNVRIVAATHRDLSQMIRQGLFREDLYYRLNVVPIRLPPLRERVDDISDLTQHFLRAAQREGEPVKTLTPEAIRLMQNYSWPGNVRELENLVRRLSALYADESVSAEIVQNELNIVDRPAVSGNTGPVDVSTAVESHVGQLLREHEPNLPPAGLYQRVIDRVEAPLIAMALNACGGNQIKAADLLGLNRNTLRKKIRTHSIEIIKHSRRS